MLASRGVRAASRITSLTRLLALQLTLATSRSPFVGQVPSRRMASTSLPNLDPQLFNRKLYQNLLDFWYEGIPRDTVAPEKHLTLRWFGLSEDPADRKAFDDECHRLAKPALDSIAPDRFPLPPFESFEADRRQSAALSAPLRANLAAVTGQEANPPMPLTDATLALTLLLDQMPRNCHRQPSGQVLVFSHYDRLARALATYIWDPANKDDPLYGIDQQPGLKHCLGHRSFLYLPLQHSEDLFFHDIIDERLKDVSTEGSEVKKEYMDQFVRFEEIHRDLLERFGRYPHRNGALGRDPTKEEKAFLDGGGQTFGTSQKEEEKP